MYRQVQNGRVSNWTFMELTIRRLRNPTLAGRCCHGSPRSAYHPTMEVLDVHTATGFGLSWRLWWIHAMAKQLTRFREPSKRCSRHLGRTLHASCEWRHVSCTISPLGSNLTNLAHGGECV